MVSSNIWPLYWVSYIRRQIDPDRNKVRFTDKSIGHFAPNQPISGESEKSKNEKNAYWKILRKKSSFNFRKSTHPNHYSLWNCSTYTRYHELWTSFELSCNRFISVHEFHTYEYDVEPPNLGLNDDVLLLLRPKLLRLSPLTAVIRNRIPMHFVRNPGPVIFETCLVNGRGLQINKSFWFMDPKSWKAFLIKTSLSKCEIFWWSVLKSKVINKYVPSKLNRVNIEKWFIPNITEHAIIVQVDDHSKF